MNKLFHSEEDSVKEILSVNKHRTFKSVTMVLFVISVIFLVASILIAVKVIAPGLAVAAIAYGIGAIVIIFVVVAQKTTLNKRLLESQKNLETRFNIINSMNSIYFASFYIDLANDSFITISSTGGIDKIIEAQGTAQAALYKACEILIVPEYQEIVHEFFDLTTVNERLKDANVVSVKYISIEEGWCMAYFIAGDRDEEGNFKHVFFACRSINDEQEREVKQVRTLEDFNAITYSAGMGIWRIIIKDGAKPRMKANKKMRELLGIEGKDLTEEEIYESWYSNIVPEEIPVVNACVDEMLTGNFSEATYRWNHPTIGRIYVRCGGNLRTSREGVFILAGYHSDVTKIVMEERKQKEELALAKDTAESANRAKTAFLLNMSHDIRTPLNAIIGYTELIQMHNDEKDRCMDYIAKIQSSGDYLLSLVNNVLDMARIESGKVVLNVEVCSMDELTDIEHIDEMSSNDIEYKCIVDVKSKYIYADKTALKDIGLNLLSNAYKYTKEGGTVTVSIKELPHPEPGYTFIQTTVADTGIGISKEFLPVLFEKFSREQNTTESKIQGTGLGLPIVKKYVELMDGTITVESELGRGTTFTVTIPHKIAEAVQSTKQDKSGKCDFEGKRVLLAEDNAFNAEIAVDLLEEKGFIVDVAEDGEICIKMLKEAPTGYYNLVLMDIQMPHMDGYEAARAIRALEDPAKAGIPIVAMTANAFKEDRDKALEVGMNGHITKPVKADKLVEILGDVL